VITRRAVALAMIGLSAFGAAACSSTDASEATSNTTSTTTTAATAPGAAGPTAGRTISVPVSLTSAQKFIHQVGPTNAKSYGVNQLVGTSTVDGQSVDVELLGTVNYVDGTGPIGSFVTLTWPNGDVLGLTMDGAATQPPDAQGTSNTHFEAVLAVIGGSGAYAGVTGGSGSFVADRNAELGGQVDGTIEVTVTGG
jgi:hypothetical protein